MQVLTPRLDRDPEPPFPSLSPHEFITPSSSPNQTANYLSAPFATPLALGRRRLDAFDIVCLIGKGGFGKVFLVRHKATAAVYAMKVMEKHVLVQRKAVQDAQTERDILAMVGQHDTPFTVRLHIAFQTSRRVYLVMDFASGGELMFHLRREAMLSEVAARFYAAELLVAIESLHNMDIVHRDIKPENVLLDGQGHLVLTDFGLAKDVAGIEDHEQAHSWCGSEDYMAPEIVSRAAHTGKPADYWAYGIFLYDCLCGQPPFSPLHEKGKLTRKRLHQRILKCKYRLPNYLSSECHSLLRKLLTKDPAKRLTDPDLIRAHPWFRTVDWDIVQSKHMVPPIIPSQSSPTACFSPSLTKVNCSAPHSPLALGEPHSIPINVPAPSDSATIQPQSSQPGDMWQGFSFVAPGMEVHFELAPPAIERNLGLRPNDNTSEPPTYTPACHTSFPSPPSATHADLVDPLVAELTEFSLDAAEAVEIVDPNTS